MTCNVFIGTLNPAQSINQSAHGKGHITQEVACWTWKIFSCLIFVTVFFSFKFRSTVCHGQPSHLSHWASTLFVCSSFAVMQCVVRVCQWWLDSWFIVIWCFMTCCDVIGRSGISMNIYIDSWHVFLSMWLPVFHVCSGPTAGEVYCVRTAIGWPNEYALQDEGEILQEDRLFLVDSLLQPSHTLPREFVQYSSSILPSVLWHCWLGIMKSIWPVKNWVVRYWLWYDMIWWTILTCAQKLTSSQLSLPHGTKQKRIMKKLKT